MFKEEKKCQDKNGEVQVMLERRPERSPQSRIQKELWGPGTKGLACEGRFYL